LVALDDNPTKKTTFSIEEPFIDSLDREPDEKNEATVYWEALFEVLSESQPTILFIKDVENLVLVNTERYAQFKKMAPKITSATLILGRHSFSTC
jgi:hypothetical protein